MVFKHLLPTVLICLSGCSGGQRDPEVSNQNMQMVEKIHDNAQRQLELFLVRAIAEIPLPDVVRENPRTIRKENCVFFDRTPDEFPNFSCIGIYTDKPEEVTEKLILDLPFLLTPTRSKGLIVNLRKNEADDVNLSRLNDMDFDSRIIFRRDSGKLVFNPTVEP